MQEAPVVEFFRLIKGGRPPKRAEPRSELVTYPLGRCGYLRCPDLRDRIRVLGIPPHGYPADLGR